jgi:hypothetical protein
MALKPRVMQAEQRMLVRRYPMPGILIMKTRGCQRIPGDIRVIKF